MKINLTKIVSPGKEDKKLCYYHTPVIIFTYYIHIDLEKNKQKTIEQTNKKQKKSMARVASTLTTIDYLPLQSGNISLSDNKLMNKSN